MNNSKSTQVNPRLFWIDLIRATATFMVVFLHSAAPVVVDPKKVPLKNWMISNIYDSSVRTCIPLFFMISGALLIIKNEQIKEYFGKRIRKVVVPLLMWSIFFVLWNAALRNNWHTNLEDWTSILYKPSNYHLWFFYPLLGIYLVIPIVRNILQKNTESTNFWILLFWFVTSAELPFIGYYISSIIKGYDLILLNFLGFAILGYYLSKIKITKKGFLASIVIFIISVLVTAIGTYYLTKRNEFILDDSLYEFFTINVILAAGSLFIFFRHLGSTVSSLKDSFVGVLINEINKKSLGIIFIHPVFIFLLSKDRLGFTLSGFSGNPIYSIPLTAFVVFGISYLTTAILQKIPVIRYSVP